MVTDMDLEVVNTLLRQAGASGDAWRTTPSDDREVITQTEHCSEHHVATAYAAGRPDKALARGRLIAAAPLLLTELVAEVERLREVENVYEQDQTAISFLHRKVRELAPYRKRAHHAEAEVKRLRKIVLDAVSEDDCPECSGYGPTPGDHDERCWIGAAFMAEARAALHPQEQP